MNKQELFLNHFRDKNNKKTYLNYYQSGIKAGYKESVARNIPAEIKKGKYKIITEGLRGFNLRAIKERKTKIFLENKITINKMVYGPGQVEVSLELARTLLYINDKAEAEKLKSHL